MIKLYDRNIRVYIRCKGNSKHEKRHYTGILKRIDKTYGMVDGKTVTDMVDGKTVTDSDGHGRRQDSDGHGRRQDSDGPS